MIFIHPTKLHIEITTRCSLQCSKCPRTIHKGSFKPNIDIDISLLFKILKNKKYETIVLCGNLGDPIYHSKFKEVLELCIKQSETVVVNTNGSGKSIDWWTDIYSIMRPTDAVYFGIDGLKDTSKYYRVNQDWQSAFSAMKLGAKLGKQIFWHWIAFRFNEHQIPEAKAISKRYGIKFFLLKSNRWDKDDPLQPLDTALYISNQ